jgi:transcriptional regulator with XRE-family HTH domain
MYQNNLIKGAMAEHDLTVEEVARMTGLNATTISFVRNGKENIMLRTLKAVADAVGLEMEIRLTPKAAHMENQEEEQARNRKTSGRSHASTAVHK